MPTLAVPTGVRSPGWRSDLGIHAALGSLEELDEGWRCELPSVPDNPFGNMLLLRGAPENHEPAAVAALFEEHFGTTAVPELCVGWDDPEADPCTLAPYLAHGFRPIDDVALALDGHGLEAQSRVAGDLVLQGVDLAHEASSVLGCELAVDAARSEPYGPDAVRRNLAWSTALIALGTGDEAASEGPVGGWYGAELEGRVVATLGIVSVGGVGRLQSVGTHPEHRNRGIGTALLAWAWRDAAERFGLGRLLLVTARDGAAERFYRRMGFRRIGASLGVMRAR